jgi:F420-non-reducing hydrogenase iron-sulfur subunit
LKKENEWMSTDFEPKIAAFACHYCAYTAADLAGSMRLDYPSTVRIVKLLCSGRVDTIHLLKAFEEGADAVFVAGWEEGDCNFLEGNYRAKNRVNYTKKLLDEIGVGGDRLEMYNIGASEGPRFAEAVEEMTAKVKELGPSPISKKKHLKGAEGDTKWLLQIVNP